MIANGVVTLNRTLTNDADRVVEVNGTGNLTLVNFDVAPSSANDNTDAVYCTGATLAILNSTIHGARDLGVLAENGCTLSIEASTISTNAGGGISITSSDFNVVNNFIVNFK